MGAGPAARFYTEAVKFLEDIESRFGEVIAAGDA